MSDAIHTSILNSSVSRSVTLALILAGIACRRASAWYPTPDMYARVQGQPDTSLQTACNHRARQWMRTRPYLGDGRVRPTGAVEYRIPSGHLPAIRVTFVDPVAVSGIQIEIEDAGYLTPPASMEIFVDDCPVQHAMTRAWKLINRPSFPRQVWTTDVTKDAVAPDRRKNARPTSLSRVLEKQIAHVICVHFASSSKPKFAILQSWIVIAHSPAKPQLIEGISCGTGRCQPWTITVDTNSKVEWPR